MEGTPTSVPSIALSQAYGGPEGHRSIRWDCAEAHAPAVIARILKAGVAPGIFVNVNFPACAPSEVAGIAITAQGRRDTELMRIEERRDGRGNPYYWLMFQRGGFTPEAGTDIEAIAAKKISLTPLRLDLTDEATRRRYAEAFG